MPYANNKAGTQSGHNYSDSDMDTKGSGKQDIGELKEAFRQYMLSAGMPSVPDSIEITGAKIPRWKDTSKQSGNKDCWYRFGINSDGSGFGKFGNHKGIEGKWHSSYDKGLPAIKLSQKEKEKLAMLKAESEKAESALREKNRKGACALFETGSLVRSLKERHWYIQEKKIKTFEGLKQERNTLLIPCYSANAELLAVQRIYKDTQGKIQKRFLGSYSGGFFIIGKIKPDGICHLTEGYATGATVYEARGAPVIVAFSSGNLLAVAKIILNLYPKIKLIIAADNDLKTLTEKNCNPGKEAAEKVSRELGLQIALSPVNSDFNDFYIQTGSMEAVKEALQNIQTPEPTKIEIQREDWQEIVPYWLGNQNNQEFQLVEGALPDCLVDFCNAVADNTETPIELSLSMMLAVLSACLQRKFEIQPITKDELYKEALCLWCVCMLESGNRKSAVLKYMQAPYNEWIKQTKESLKDEIEKSNKNRELQEIRIKALEAEYKKSNKKSNELKELEQQILQLNSELIPIRKMPKFITQDVTTEKLGKLLAENNGCISLFSAEGGIFDTIAGRYSKTGTVNMDIYNQTYSGELVIKDRANKDGSFEIDNTALTIGIAPQPSVLENLKNKQDFINRGFFPRALITQPDSLLGKRTHDKPPIPKNLIEQYNILINKLCNLKMLDKPIILKASKQAYENLRNFIQKRESYLGNEDNEGLKAWNSKLQGQIIRIAAIFHCIDNISAPEEKEISDKQIERAIALAEDLFIPHAIKIFGGFQDSTQTRNIKKTIKKLSKEKEIDKTTFSHRFSYIFQKAKERDEIIDLLIKENILKEKSISTKTRTKKLYIINPKLHKAFNK